MRIQDQTSVIIGTGEIGTALANMLDETHTVIVKDEGEEYYRWNDFQLDGIVPPIRPLVLHICFPYFDGFEQEVMKYKAECLPVFTVIHSTVPIGTSSKCGASHSPILGRHPFIESALKNYTKFIGGPEAGDVANYFRKSGFKVYVTDKSESTELMKIDSTTWFGLMVEKTKDTKRLCDKYDVPFELFTIWTKEYNEGVIRAGQQESVRPNLVPIMAKIGGHCILPNAKLVEGKFAKILLEMNDEC